MQGATSDPAASGPGPGYVRPTEPGRPILDARVADHVFAAQVQDRVDGLVPLQTPDVLLFREERLTVRLRGGRKRALGTRAPMVSIGAQS